MTSRKAFTLVELLITIGLIAILSVVVVAIINPVESIRQGRDAARISDMSTLNGAINLYSSDQAGASAYSIGSANTIYISVPDSTATGTAGDQCQGLGLASLPSGYTYHCAATSTYRKTDGTGWIPINFATSTAGASISKLPVDPTNTSSSRLYYTYTTNGVQYETTASMESTKFKLGGINDQITNDGGALATVFEKGTKIGLEPMDYGDTNLIGYWPMDEGTGSSTYDYSGGSNTGTWSGTQSGTSGYYSAGKIGPWAGAFDGTSAAVTIPFSSSLNITGPVTIAAWIYPLSTGNYQCIFLKGHVSSGSREYSLFLAPSQNQVFVGIGGASGFNNIITVTTSWQLNQWNHVVMTADGTNIKIYLNGQLVGTTASTVTAVTGVSTSSIGYDVASAGYYAKGEIDDVRVYNRALSAAEIQALYNGVK